MFPQLLNTLNTTCIHIHIRRNAPMADREMSRHDSINRSMAMQAEKWRDSVWPVTLKLLLSDTEHSNC